MCFQTSTDVFYHSTETRQKNDLIPACFMQILE